MLQRPLIINTNVADSSQSLDTDRDYNYPTIRIEEKERMNQERTRAVQTVAGCSSGRVLSAEEAALTVQYVKQTEIIEAGPFNESSMVISGVKLK